MGALEWIRVYKTTSSTTRQADGRANAVKSRFSNVKKQSGALIRVKYKKSNGVVKSAKLAVYWVLAGDMGIERDV